MTRPQDDDRMNVRSASFFLAFAVGRCQHCGRQTALLAIGVPAGSERRDEDEWGEVGGPTLLFDIEALADDIGELLRNCAPHYHAATGAPAGEGRWQNHCESCGEPQDDYWLHCEPDAPFLPLTPEAASRIDLVAIDAALLACACGFSEGVPLLDAMRRGG
jgi:ribosomal protein S14